MAAVIAPQAGKQELMLNIDASVIIVGGAAGSAKSYSALMRSLRYITDPFYEAIYFRRTTSELTGQGGLWSKAQDLYSSVTKIRCKEKDLKITFEEYGSSVKFSHMELDSDARKHQGLQYSAIFFDELTHFSEYQFTYLMTRARSEAENDSFVFASCNPDADSWVLKWVEWYLDEDGYPDESKCGKIRYFVMVEGQPKFADTREEIEKLYPEQCYIKDQNTGEVTYIPAKTFTFINATIFDNPILIKTNPTYLADLQAQPEVERARLLHGNWYARAKGSNYFQRDWLKKADKVPLGCKQCRAWDKASQEPSEKNRYPDYTAGSPLFSKDKDGFTYISWGFDKDIKDDEESQITGQFRKRPGERDALILKQAKKDGTDVHVVFSVDPGAAGKVEYQESAKKLIREGFVVKEDPMPNNKSKLKRFEPFSSACQNGLVYIVESSFPNKETLEHFYKCLEAFTGEDSTSAYKDDIPDATASGFNYIQTAKVLKPFSMPGSKGNNTTRFREVMNSPLPIFGNR